MGAAGRQDLALWAEMSFGLSEFTAFGQLFPTSLGISMLEPHLRAELCPFALLLGKLVSDLICNFGS